MYTAPDPLLTLHQEYVASSSVIFLKLVQKCLLHVSTAFLSDFSYHSTNKKETPASRRPSSKRILKWYEKTSYFYCFILVQLCVLFNVLRCELKRLSKNNLCSFVISLCNCIIAKIACCKCLVKRACDIALYKCHGCVSAELPRPCISHR
mgnify:CR=1 FL=1